MNFGEMCWLIFQFYLLKNIYNERFLFKAL
nr:MAG TPA: hypothetical protein [Caudoviricetes sp.]